MKKLMTSTIILLPLIILAILLVSGAIKALMTHIYVDRVEFVDDDTLVLVMDDEENPPDEKLEVNVLPLKADNRELVFTIDDESIATVDKDGNVVAKYYGETYVNVMSAEDNLKKDRRRVLVTDDAVHKIEIADNYEADLYEDRTQSLSVIVYPREATERGVTWESSDPDILEISTTGIVRAKGAGEVTVTATSVENGDISDSVTITCHSAIESISTGLSRVETALETAQFPQIIQSPLDADITIAYTSDDPDIAKVDENGQITFLEAGKVTITATATDFGSTTKSTSIEYVSTLHYYRLPIFEQKAYTVDFDEYYGTGRALEIPFAAGFEPANTNQKIVDVAYSIQKKVLEFDEAKEEFRFVGEMPAGTSAITVTVRAQVYDTETNEITEKEDAFTLTVLRKAQSIAVGYKGTASAQSIVLSGKTLIFGTDSNATAPVSVFPANHTDKLSYALENAEGTATLSGGTLTFQRAGSVTVLVSCKYTESGEAHAPSRITVSYAPATEAEHKKSVEIAPPAEDQQPAKREVLLSMDGSTKEEGVLYFAEPAGTTVTYAVEDEANAAVELQVVDGAQHIVPKKGGFATITITVAPNPAAAIALFSAPRSGEPEGVTTYTVEVYVDRAVKLQNLSVRLNGKDATKTNFGAAGTEVSYQVDVDEKESAMAGKVLYVTYSGLAAPENGAENGKTMSGNIAFPAEEQELTVTFGVKYSEKAVGLGAKGTLPTASRTITRNADSMTLEYRGTTVSAITTSSQTLTFKETATTDAGEVYVNITPITPAKHTDTIEYSVTEGDAKFDGNQLKFKNAKAPCTVTVQVLLRGRDGEVSLTKTLVVNYVPRSGNETVSLPEENGSKLLLAMGDVVEIDYVVPAGATVECTAENGAVEVKQVETVWTITALKGGFDTVTVNVTGEGVSATYTVNVYVDHTVANDFTVELGGTEVSQYYSTTENTVSFTVTVNCEKDAMAGKKLYVKYGGEIKATGTEGDTAFSDTITFPAESSTLPVTFGVMYADDANAYSPSGTLPTAARTITRNADGITFSYRGTTVDTITTTSQTLSFGTVDTSDANKVYVNIAPAGHTDTAKYSLAEGHSDGASITSQGVLTFTDANKACSVTVQIQLTGKDGNVSLTETVVVNYAPRNGAKVVTLSGDSQKLLLAMGDTVKIDYVVPAGAAVECTATKSGVVNVGEKDYEWTVTPAKGGFDTVTIQVTGAVKKTYTIEIYVDRTVANNFTIELGGAEVSTQYYSTKENAVSFRVTVNCEEGAMEGKKLYVKYGGAIKATGKEGETTFSGEIDFENLATLEVTFGVQYAERAEDFGKTGEIKGVSASRTVARRAESVTFSYKGTTVSDVTTTSTTLTFKTSKTTNAGEVYVEIQPAQHTDTVKYSLKEEGADATIDPTSGELKFTKADAARTVTVKIQLVGKDGKDSISKEIQVHYTPRGAQDKEVNLPDDDKTALNLLLFMSGTSTDKGKIVYVKPADTTVECTAKNNVVSVTEENGEWTITPQKGGFDVVTFKVTGGDTNKTYTINVYVNRAVTSVNFSVTFKEGEKPIEERENVYGTTATTVSFEVTVNCLEGAMAGKKIYVNYKGQSAPLTGDENSGTFTGTITFPVASATLEVTFGVEYDAVSTSAYKPEKSDDVALSSTVRTLARNAESITVTYNDVQTAKIVTKDTEIDFNGRVTVAPAAHTDTTLAYVLEDGDGIATLTGSKLTFQKTGTVTVKVQTKRGETVTLTKEITVTHEPVGNGNTEITLTKSTQNIVLTPTQQALIYFTEKEGATVTYKIEDGTSDVINLEQQHGISGKEGTGIYHIVPKHGGFAKVIVTVSEDEEYTVNVYVDEPVAKENISVQFEDTPVADVYGTTLESVRFTVTVGGNASAMQGKRLYVEYGGTRVEAQATEGETSFTGTIPFPVASGTLQITVGVEYTEEAKAYSPEGGVQSTTRKIERNAESITVKYGGVETAKIVTKENVIDFGTEQVIVAPTAHTDTLSYALEGNGNGIATLTGAGLLTFKEAGTVTLTLKTVRDGADTGCEKTITVTYEGLDGNNKEIPLNKIEQKIVMEPDEVRLIYFTEKEGTTVTYAVTKGEGGVITAAFGSGADETSGVYHITAQHGGFATVTVTVSGAESKTYTVNIYVDEPVTSDMFQITFKDGEKALTESKSVYGTTAATVSFEIAVSGNASAMQGKRLYVEYGGTRVEAQAKEGETSFKGTIPFPVTSGTLQIIVGVEYTEEAKAYSPEGGVQSTTRKIERNAESITVKYGGVATTKIVTKENVIDFGTEQVMVAPAAHTDTLSYALEGNGNGIASITGAGLLTFQKAGTVTLTLKTVRNGAGTGCSETITVTYEPDSSKEEITLNTTEQNIVMEPGAARRIYFTEPKGSQVTYNAGDGDVITTAFQNGADVNSGVYHITAQKGGFATVTVKVSGAESKTYTVNIYVDAPVTEGDFTVQFNGQEVTTLKTSKTEVTYEVTVEDNNGSMAGKTLCVLIGDADNTPVEGTLTKTATVKFDGTTTLTFIFSVKYADVYGKSGEEAYRTTTAYTATTTNGKLDTAPTVTYNNGGAAQLNKDGTTDITFDNISKAITFTINTASLIPADYTLSTDSLEFVGDDYVGFTAGYKGRAFTLTAKKCTVNKQYTVTIGGQDFKLNITVQAKAQEIQVTCGKTVLGSGEKYKTLLGELTFAVKAIRHDSEPITNPALEYAVGNSDDWKSIENDQYTLSDLAIGEGEKEVKFRTKDGSNLSFTLLVKRVQLNDFSLEVGISFNDGNPPVVIGETKSVADAKGSLQFTLPASNSGTVALYIVADADYLGGFGTDDQFKAIVPAKWQSVDWKIEHTLTSTGKDVLPHANINLTVPSNMKDPASVEIGGGTYCLPQRTIAFTPSTANIAMFEFPGFDGDNSADVYKGYQQVRVFAKKSDYGKGDGKLVDYYRVPVAAYEKVTDMKVDPETGKRNPMTDLTGLTWTLTSYTYTENEETKGGIEVTQTGTTVTYTYKKERETKTETYNIVKAEDGTVTLQLPSESGATTIVNADGTYAAGQPHVPWVDTVSEAAEGYIRVYFGDFVGLSESDVRNDLFGNFGEEEAWEKSKEQKDIKGEDIIPSPGAFSFLRLEGGDGRTNAHFNFNVLEDDTLVNVFNATGYYAHSKVVLHENLYGPNELTNEGGTLTAASAAEQDLILTKTNESEAKPWLASDSNVLGKTIIYGNGYQVNFEAKTAQLKAHGDTGTSRGVYLQKVINADVKASNPKDSITKTNQPVVMIMEYAYYSTIEYYSKISPWGAGTNTPGYIHLKNTVLRCCAQSALQLYYSTSTAYIENVVLNECVGGFNSDSKDGTYHVVYNFKGFVDVLNYMSYMQLGNSTGAGASLMDTFGFTPYMQACDPFLEWFGQTPDKLTPTEYYMPQDWWGTRFANVFLYNRSVPSHQSTVTLKFWDESTGKYDEKGESENGIKVTAPIDVTFDSRQEKYKIFVYDKTVDSDGGLKTDSADYNGRDMSQLFSENRYIRLLCQYKTITGKGYNATPVKNYEHIQWHTNRVYRDYSLTGHEREDHIENLKKSLEDVKWPDGTTLQQALDAAAPALAMNELLSETVIPEKRAY